MVKKRKITEKGRKVILEFIAGASSAHSCHKFLFFNKIDFFTVSYLNTVKSCQITEKVIKTRKTGKNIYFILISCKVLDPVGSS